MSFDQLIHHYGLLALFVGAGIEGEAVVLSGGILARRGEFPLAAAMAVTAAGSFLADQIWFHVGRHLRGNRYVEKIEARPAFVRALKFVERYPIGFIFAFRFIYGLRTVSPIAIGTSTVPTKLFVIVNAIAAIVWGCVFTALGYAAGKKVLELIHRYRPSGWTIALVAGGAVLAFALFHLVRWLWQRRRPAA